MLGSQRLQGDRTQDVMRQDTTEEIRSCLANGTVLADGKWWPPQSPRAACRRVRRDRRDGAELMVTPLSAAIRACGASSPSRGPGRVLLG
jgi:hypothetical protein